MTKINPLGNRLLVKIAKPDAKKGAILLPDSAQEKRKQATVIAVGPGKRDEQGRVEPVQVKVGDLVLFGSYSGTAVSLPGMEEDHLILAEEDVLGVFS